MANGKDVATTPTVAEEATSSDAVVGTPDAELNLEGMAENVADSGDTGEGGKLKMIMSLLKRCFGVKDLAAMFVFISALLDV